MRSFDVPLANDVAIPLLIAQRQRRLVFSHFHAGNDLTTREGDRYALVTGGDGTAGVED